MALALWLSSYSPACKRVGWQRCGGRAGGCTELDPELFCRRGQVGPEYFYTARRWAAVRRVVDGLPALPVRNTTSLPRRILSTATCPLQPVHRSDPDLDHRAAYGCDHRLVTSSSSRPCSQGDSQSGGRRRAAEEAAAAAGRKAAVAAADPWGRLVEQDLHPYGTVGAVARDSAGHLAAATSTGGTNAKPHGRVGDTPLLVPGTPRPLPPAAGGAHSSSDCIAMACSQMTPLRLQGVGTWAKDSTCAISATGHGEGDSGPSRALPAPVRWLRASHCVPVCFAAPVIACQWLHASGCIAVLLCFTHVCREVRTRPRGNRGTAN